MNPSGFFSSKSADEKFLPSLTGEGGGGTKKWNFPRRSQTYKPYTSAHVFCFQLNASLQPVKSSTNHT